MPTLLNPALPRPCWRPSSLCLRANCHYVHDLKVVSTNTCNILFKGYIIDWSFNEDPNNALAINEIGRGGCIDVVKSLYVLVFVHDYRVGQTMLLDKLDCRSCIVNDVDAQNSKSFARRLPGCIVLLHTWYLCLTTRTGGIPEVQQHWLASVIAQTHFLTGRRRECK